MNGKIEELFTKIEKIVDDTRKHRDIHYYNCSCPEQIINDIETLRKEYSEESAKAEVGEMGENPSSSAGLSKDVKIRHSSADNSSEYHVRCPHGKHLRKNCQCVPGPSRKYLDCSSCLEEEFEQK